MGKDYTDAQKRAIKKYIESIGEIKLRTSKEDMERYKQAAKDAGMSMNAFAIQAIEEKIERER